MCQIDLRETLYDAAGRSFDGPAGLADLTVSRTGDL
jgi:hypothetical protein